MIRLADPIMLGSELISNPRQDLQGVAPATMPCSPAIRTGLIGRGIAASRSPWLHQQEARAQGLDLTYELMDFEALGLPDSALAAFARELPERGFSGVNVTFPFKQSVIAALDGLAESADLVGAVNTVAIRDGRLIGHNTDMTGFAESLKLDLAGAALDRVLQVGAGGAGAAVAIALVASGVRQLIIADIDFPRAKALCDRVGGLFGTGRAVPGELDNLPVGQVDGIVNATPIGMAVHPGMPFDPAPLEARQWVVDIIYFPVESELLRVARDRGCRTLNGSGMVVAQAALAFEIMTGSKADTDRMRMSFLAGKTAPLYRD